MVDDAKRKQVYEVLLMPIKCENHSGFRNDRKVVIRKEGNCIKTTETYWRPYKDRETGESFRYSFIPDCDMSDFACGYYEIIYKEILKDVQKLVDDDGDLVNREFAGDTMTSVSKLPQLRNSYHCLANFWMVPEFIGRTSKYTPNKYQKWSKTSSVYNIQDFMDRFLVLINENFEVYKSLYPSYFKNIDTFEHFVEIHYLGGVYVDEDYNVIKFSNNIDMSTPNILLKAMKNRAEKISKSKYVDKLWDYFNEYGLFK